MLIGCPRATNAKSWAGFHYVGSKPTLSDAGVYDNSDLTRRAFAAPARCEFRGNEPMIEPRDRDWGPNVDWTRVPNIEPRVPALLAHFKAHWAAREVLVFDERSLTYGELENKSALLARRLLAAGIGKGSRVGIMLPNDESFLITWMAITRVGAVAVTVSTLSTGEEIVRIARHADLDLLFAVPRYLHHDYVARMEAALPGFASASGTFHFVETPYLRAIWLWGSKLAIPAWATRVDLAPEPDIEPQALAAAEAEVRSSDVAGIIYTSGSTAEPKGVIHSHGNFIRQGMKLAVSFGYENDERLYASMPFFWVGGLVTTAMCAMSIGAAMLASAKTGAELLDFLEGERTTAVVSWPHIIRSLVSDPTFAKRQWSAMRSGLLYEALPADRRPRDPTLMSAPIGMTETAGPYTIMQRNLPEEQRGSLGPLMPGLEARLVDAAGSRVLAAWEEGEVDADSDGEVGELQLRSDVMMLGMVKRERADIFTSDGWYSTRDLCSFRRGHLHYHGRVDDLIKASGANVSPAEVEAALLKIAGVASAHVAGVPDRERGSVVGALLVAQPGARLDAQMIRTEAARSLSSFKVPRVVLIVESSQVPTLPSSKIDRRAVASMLLASCSTL
jgi:acyl-CoA synthetase (AMP-forming)/AMP-acid ligase II